MKNPAWWVGRMVLTPLGSSKSSRLVKIKFLRCFFNIFQYGNLFFVSCLINPSDYTRGGWLTRRPIPKAKYMTLGPKFFCCSKMAVTRRRKHLFQ